MTTGLATMPASARGDLLSADVSQFAPALKPVGRVRSRSLPATRTCSPAWAAVGAAGGFPDAGGRLSTSAPIRIVRPIMLQARVPREQAHPHTLRHTFGWLYTAAPQAGLSPLRRIMGHAPPDRQEQRQAWAVGRRSSLWH